MKITKTPDAIWKEYGDGINFKTQIDLFNQVKDAQNMYVGKQWEGVNAPNIEKPVKNVCRPAVDFSIAMLVSDDVAVTCDFGDAVSDDMKKTKDAIEYITTVEINKVFEQTKYKTLLRQFVKDCAINGDAYKHWWFNTKKNTQGTYKGQIDLELIDNTNIIFGNPADHRVENQPYILIVQKLPTEEVRDMVKKSLEDGIVSDSEDYTTLEDDSRAVENYTTVITKLWKENGSIWSMKTTQKVIIKSPIDLMQKKYPISRMPWRSVKNNYHGLSMITEIIPNQVMINKFYMMQNEFMKKLAFPKVFYDKTKIASISNKIDAIGVNGNPTDVIMTTSPVVNMSEQSIRFLADLIERTNQTLGIYDVSLGNVKAENTSAIIALQKTAAQPLELQKLDLFQSVEDDVRIIVDIMSAYYGIREVPFKTEEGNGTIPFDYKDVSYEDFGMNVEVGSSYYWSEVTAIQTLDNMFNKGLLDPVTYLEQLPNGILKNRGDIVQAYKEKQANELAMAQAQAMPQPQGNTGLPVIQ